MRIGIDISQVIYGTGVSNYTRNLVTNLLKIDKKNQYVLLGGSMRRKAELVEFTESLKGSFQPKLYNYPPALADLFWNKMHIINAEVLTGPIDLFHSSDWAQPPSKAIKVTTVHDLTPLLHQKDTSAKVVQVHMRRLEHVKYDVDAIIVPSEATKSDLVDAGTKESKIEVIYEAADPIFVKKSKAEIDKARLKYGIEEDYMLTFGHSPRKNVKRTISAFKYLKKKGDASQLIVIGAELEKQVDGVKVIGFVDREDLPALYSGAQMLLYVSFYEGFGLPILEAFACKTPVVTSNISSMPEIADKAGVLVDPYDTQSIIRGVKKALSQRKSLISKGDKRVKQFSWEDNARETLKLYNRLLN